MLHIITMDLQSVNALHCANKYVFYGFRLPLELVMRSDSATALKTAGQSAVRRALSSAVGKDKE